MRRSRFSHDEIMALVAEGGQRRSDRGDLPVRGDLAEDLLPVAAQLENRSFRRRLGQTTTRHAPPPASPVRTRAVSAGSFVRIDGQL